MHRVVTDPGLTLPAIVPTHGASERRVARRRRHRPVAPPRNSAPVSGVPSRVPPSLNPAVALPTPNVRPAAQRPPAYERLVGLVLALNAGVLGFHLQRGDWRLDDGSAASAFAALMLVNFAAAVLIRQQTVLNVLYGLAGRGSRAWPLWLRWSLSNVHHVGGVHAGAALAGTCWLAAFAWAAKDADATTRALA